MASYFNVYLDKTNGNDGNTGSSWTRAYKTLDKALYETISVFRNNNDQADKHVNLYIAPGSYGIVNGSIIENLGQFWMNGTVNIIGRGLVIIKQTSLKSVSYKVGSLGGGNAHFNFYNCILLKNSNILQLIANDSNYNYIRSINFYNCSVAENIVTLDGVFQNKTTLFENCSMVNLNSDATPYAKGDNIQRAVINKTNSASTQTITPTFTNCDFSPTLTSNGLIAQSSIASMVSDIGAILPTYHKICANSVADWSLKIKASNPTGNESVVFNRQLAAQLGEANSEYHFSYVSANGYIDCTEQRQLTGFIYANYYLDPTRGIKDIAIAGSNDNSSWTSIETITLEKHSANQNVEWRCVNLSAVSSLYRYFRLTINSGWGYPSNPNAYMVGALVPCFKDIWAGWRSNGFVSTLGGSKKLLGYLMDGWKREDAGAGSIMATDDDNSVLFIDGTTAKLLSPVYDYGEITNISAIKIAGVEDTSSPGANKVIDSTPYEADTVRHVEYRHSNTPFLQNESDTTLPWTQVIRNEPITQQNARYVQYRVTLAINAQ